MNKVRNRQEWSILLDTYFQIYSKHVLGEKFFFALFFAQGRIQSE